MTFTSNRYFHMICRLSVNMHALIFIHAVPIFSLKFNAVPAEVHLSVAYEKCYLSWFIQKRPFSNMAFLKTFWLFSRVAKQFLFRGEILLGNETQSPQISNSVFKKKKDFDWNQWLYSQVRHTRTIFKALTISWSVQN